VCTALAAVSGTLDTGIVAIGGTGAGFLMIVATNNSSIQALAREPWRGRVLGIWLMAYGIAYPVGVLVQGVLVDAFGVRSVLLADAAILAGVTVLLAARRSLEATDRAVAALPVARPDPVADGSTP